MHTYGLTMQFFPCEKEKKILLWVGMKPAVLMEREQEGLESFLPSARKTKNENTHLQCCRKN